METTWIPRLNSIRRTSIIMGVANLAVVILGTILLLVSSSACDLKQIFPLATVSFAAGIKIVAMVKTGMAQQLTAGSIIDSPSQSNAVIRHERRMRYKTWLWWTRFAIVITVLQFVAATYLMFHVFKFVSHDGMTRDCFLGLLSNGSRWKQNLLVSFMIIVCFVALVQCFTGSDVLRWRSFYAAQDDAWKAHYQEVFDHGIREAMCCLGRAEYLSVLEEDEVYSVARLLGDLVTYRASGTGHLELLAGLALLQRHSQSPKSYEGFAEAPEEQLQEAATFHKFAEAAYTGPLLDFGRNPILFPCAWIYRQGILTPWTHNRRPILDGDNWWRGHAAAFLKFINLSPDVLRRGRVCQGKCEVAYFVVVLHQLRCVVIAVRGTETPEDLLIDGLGGACPLSTEDLDGLINSSHIKPLVKQSVELSFPHYGHLGIVEAARDLFKQIEGDHGDEESESIGFLSSLLGAGCECDGYSVRIVGHSMGGAIATLLALRLFRKFPNLHAYTYGPLPCVDSVVADACSEFVTSIVLDNEFSARLSVGSILRLRAAAITALSQDFKTDTTLIYRLARRFLCVSNYQRNEIEMKGPAEVHPVMSSKDSDHHFLQGSKEQNQEISLWHEADMGENAFEIDDENFINPFYDMAADVNPLDDPVSQFMETVPRSENGSARDPPEMFLPGLVIHIVPQRGSINVPLWKAWRILDGTQSYKAFIADKECFKDIVVSQSMFIDHFPWRCRHAMQKVLEARNGQRRLDESQMV